MHRWYIGFLLSLMLLLASCNQSSSDLEAQAGSWQLLVPAKGTQGNFPSPIHSMAIDSVGNPGYIYYRSGFPYNPPGFVYSSNGSWVGGTIELLPQDINPNNWIGYRDIDITFDSQNRPVVAYGKWVAGVGVYIYVKRWNPATGNWRTFDPIPLSDYPNGINLEIANSIAIVAYMDAGELRVKRQSCHITCSWVNYPAFNENIRDFSLALDNFNRPIIAYTTWINSELHVFVKKLSTPGWETLGTALNIPNQSAYGPHIITDSNGNPVVLFAQVNQIYTDQSSYLYIKRWNGTTQSWQQLGNYITDNSAGYWGRDIVLDASGNPYVIWKNEVNQSLGSL
jgi:hypothetical protein